MEGNTPPKLFTLKNDDKIAIERKVIKKSKGNYECTICNNVFDRRYNGLRHFDRFHTSIECKTCCRKMFSTKGEYYDHREQMHNDVKRYGRQWKDKLSKFEYLNEETGESSSRQNEIPTESRNREVDMLSNSVTSDMQPNTTSLERDPKKTPHLKNRTCMDNHDQRRVVLQDIENPINDTTNNVSQNVTRMHSVTSQNVPQTDKENIRVYAWNYKSESELKMALTSIKF
ncbi:hypothetical protein DMN91_008610 [Ooceraea biroi]|uniref:C2H2-type domain-containing protein n=1 Tax=Ooceraea biroi TaxID=2015173 RepID=A0A3L8DD18_OOCBI|nr:hypothetical protein DMN91_008610 [Ooceraea biroi]